MEYIPSTVAKSRKLRDRKLGPNAQLTCILPSGQKLPSGRHRCRDPEVMTARPSMPIDTLSADGVIINSVWLHADGAEPSILGVAAANDSPLSIIEIVDILSMRRKKGATRIYLRCMFFMLPNLNTGIIPGARQPSVARPSRIDQRDIGFISCC